MTTDMTPQEQLLLELVNRARANPAAEAALFEVDLNQGLAEDAISPDPKQPLAPNQFLVNAARAHAELMLQLDFFEHVDPFGMGPGDRAAAAGYTGGVGENIAWYGDGRTIDIDQQTYDRHEALFLSPGHRQNMMVAGYRELGTAVETGLFERLNSVMVAEEFGNRGGPNFFITGIAYTDRITRDQFYDIGEGLSNISVQAVRLQDGTRFNASTGAAGGYAIEVPAGTYTVTATGNGITGSMTVANVIINGENQKVDFNTRVSTVATISGGVFHDLNANGIRNSNEAALSGRTVFLDNDGDGILDSDELRATTNNDGEYQFKGLRAGTYQIRQVTLDGWQATSPIDDVFEIEVLAGINRTGLLFGSKVANRTPVAQDDELIAEAGFPVTIDVLVNDSDPDGTLDPQSVEITFPSIKGTATVDPTTGHITYTATAGRSGDDILLYSVKDNEGAVSNQAAVQIVISNGPGNSWQNPNQRFDVNGDAAISPIDALIVLNDLDSQGARRMSVPSGTTLPPPYVDVTGDGFLSPLDALQVINELDRIAKSAEGEGESAADAVGLERLESAAMRDAFLATDAAFALLAIESTSDNHRRTQHDSDTNLPLR